MKKIEIESIIEAAAKKHSWVIREFKNFLAAWEKIEVPDDYEGQRELILYEIETERGNPRRYFLTLGKNFLDYETNDGYGWEDSESYPTLTLARVRRCIAALEIKLPEFFKTIQAEIDTMSDSGQKISNIINALS